MSKDPVRRCKACWHGDCADCSQWTDQHSTCLHRCDVLPKQLALPFDGKESTGADSRTELPSVPAPSRD